MATGNRLATIRELEIEVQTGEIQRGDLGSTRISQPTPKLRFPQVGTESVDGRADLPGVACAAADTSRALVVQGRAVADERLDLEPRLLQSSHD
jgi:hypothetical protein